MGTLAFRRSFAFFHATLAAVVFVESLRTALSSLHGNSPGPLGSHLAILAGVEALGAVLFLIPRTLKIGSAVLLLVFGVVVFVHGILQELDVLVFGAGVIFVAVHGSAFSKELIKASS